MNVSGADGAVRVKTAKVLPRFFDVWTVAPLAGRAILDADFEGDGRVAVVSERLWRSRMGADRGAVGSMLRIDGVPYSVLGVMPAAASAIGQFEIWIPWIMTADERANRQFHLVGAIGRLRDNLTAAEASASLRRSTDGSRTSIRTPHATGTPRPCRSATACSSCQALRPPRSAPSLC